MVRISEMEGRMYPQLYYPSYYYRRKRKPERKRSKDEDCMTPGNFLPICGLVLSCFVFLLLVVSIAIPYWVYYELPMSKTGHKRYHGLWRGCRKSDMFDDEKCMNLHNYHDIPAFLDATRVLEVLGLFFITVSVVTASLYTCVIRDKVLLLYLTGCSAAISGVCTLVGTAVYGAKYKEIPLYYYSDLHAGFITAVIGGFLALVATFLFMCAPRHKT